MKKLVCVAVAAVMAAGMAGAAPLMYMGVHDEHKSAADHLDLAALALFDVVAGADGHNYLTIQLINASATPSYSTADILTSVFFDLATYSDKGMVGVGGNTGRPVLTPVSAMLAPANPMLAGDLYDMLTKDGYEPQASAVEKLLSKDSTLTRYSNSAGRVETHPTLRANDFLNDEWMLAYPMDGSNATRYFPDSPFPYYGIGASVWENSVPRVLFPGSIEGPSSGASFGLLSADSNLATMHNSTRNTWYVDGSMIFTFLLPDDYTLDLENDIILQDGFDKDGNYRTSVWFGYRDSLDGDTSHPMIRGQDKGRIPEPATMSLLALGGLALLRRRK